MLKISHLSTEVSAFLFLLLLGDLGRLVPLEGLQRLNTVGPCRVVNVTCPCCNKVKQYFTTLVSPSRVPKPISRNKGKAGNLWSSRGSKLILGGSQRQMTVNYFSVFMVSWSVYILFNSVKNLWILSGPSKQIGRGISFLTIFRKTVIASKLKLSDL